MPVADGEPRAGVIAGTVHAWMAWAAREIAAKPQPQPWRLLDLLRRLGKPQPDPWSPGERIGRARRATLVTALARAVAGEAIRLELRGGLAEAFLHAVVTDYCGTPPRRPIPFPSKSLTITPADRALIAAELRAIATAGGGEALAETAAALSR